MRTHFLFPSLKTTLLTIAVILASGTACSKKPPKTSTEPLWSGDISVTVKNHNYLDVTIYVVHDGQRTRIGVAGGSMTSTFLFSALMLGQSRQLYLIGDPIGSPEVIRTETLTIQPGQYIEWWLESGLSRSSVAVY